MEKKRSFAAIFFPDKNGLKNFPEEVSNIMKKSHDDIFEIILKLTIHSFLTISLMKNFFKYCQFHKSDQLQYQQSFQKQDQ